MTKSNIVITETEKGISEVRRNEGELPFALVVAPSRRNSRKWGVHFRSGPNDQTPFDLDNANSAHDSFAALRSNLEQSVCVCSSYQLGLSETP